MAIELEVKLDNLSVGEFETLVKQGTQDITVLIDLMGKLVGKDIRDLPLSTLMVVKQKVMEQVQNWAEAKN